MADIRHLENCEIAISEQKKYPILMQFGTQQQIWNSVTVSHMTKYEFFFLI